jgi:hypothetical protein
MVAIRVIWRFQYLAGGADLADLASIHYRDTVGELGYDRKIVRDEQVGEAELVAQLGQQIDDCRLHRHIECGDRLIADDSGARWRVPARSPRVVALHH